MIPYGNNIYTNFAPQPIHHNKSVKLIIIGQCGIGKSRVVNNICKSSQRTGISIGSITHNIFKGQCSLPNKCSLWLVDTPGVEKNSRLTSLTLKRALRCLPWTKIVVMAKFDARFENSTLAELRKISRAFGKEPGRVAFLVSHLDIVDDRPDDVNTKEEVL